MAELEQNPLIPSKTWKELNEGVNSQYDFQKTTFGGTQTGVVASNLMLYDAVVDWEGHGDFVNIQDAIDAGKKKIFIRSGTYTLESPITIDEPEVQLFGERNSETGTVITSNEGSSSEFYLIQYTGTFANSYGYSIENIYFKGKDDVAYSLNGILWMLSNRAVGNVPINEQIAVKNCSFVDFYNGYVFTTTDTYCALNIINNLFIDCLGCIYGYGEADAYSFIHSRISNNLVYLGRDNSIFIYVGDKSYDVVISNNSVFSTGGTNKTAILLGNVSTAYLDSYLITGNIFARSLNEPIITASKLFANIIYCTGLNGSTISNNQMFYSIFAAIKLTKSYNVNINGNFIYFPSYDNVGLYSGLYLDTCTHIVFSGNNVNGQEYTKCGFEEKDASCDSNVITSNLISFCTNTDGFIIFGTSDEVGHNNVVT